MLVTGPVRLSIVWLVFIHAIEKEVVGVSLLCLVSLHLILLEFSSFLIGQLSVEILEIVLNIVLLHLVRSMRLQFLFLTLSVGAFLDR